MTQQHFKYNKNRNVLFATEPHQQSQQQNKQKMNQPTDVQKKVNSSKNSNQQKYTRIIRALNNKNSLRYHFLLTHYGNYFMHSMDSFSWCAFSTFCGQMKNKTEQNNERNEKKFIHFIHTKNIFSAQIAADFSLGLVLLCC